MDKTDKRQERQKRMRKYKEKKYENGKWIGMLCREQLKGQNKIRTEKRTLNFEIHRLPVALGRAILGLRGTEVEAEVG